MADSPPPSPPPPPTAPTTITALSDDILLNIFLRLPDIMSLARVAFASPAFLHAVRSSPAFRRRFRELRAPPLLALFREPHMHAIIPEGAGPRSDIAAVFCAFDGLLDDSGADEFEWWSDPAGINYCDGYAVFFNRATDQCARYSPHSQALNIYSKKLRYGDPLLEFHTLSTDGEEQRPSRVVCVHRDRDWAWARAAVFSAYTMEWQVVLPKMEMRGLLVEPHEYATGMVVNGFICWVHERKLCILALNTATFQFSRMELPLALKGRVSKFQLGHTKDGDFCVVSVLQCTLSIWLWATDSDGVQRFMLHKSISLRANVREITECSEEADVRMRSMAVINGFVYLSLIIDYWDWEEPDSPEWFVSLCVETAEVNLLHKESPRMWCSFDPYIMVSWPSSLIHGKEDSEARVTGHISEYDGHMGTEEASPVLFTALQSFKEKLIDDDNLNFAEIDSFLLDDERNSLLNRITTLELELVAARDRFLRFRTEPNSMNGMELITSESEGTESDSESDSMEGTERGSCWQMCKEPTLTTDPHQPLPFAEEMFSIWGSRTRDRRTFMFSGGDFSAARTPPSVPHEHIGPSSAGTSSKRTSRENVVTSPHKKKACHLGEYMYSLSESIAARNRSDRGQDEQSELVAILIEDGVPEGSELFLKALHLFQKPVCCAQFKNIKDRGNRIKYIDWTWANTKAKGDH